MNRVKFVVRWKDQEGKDHRREYDKEPEARKARDWLLANGAPSADVAVQMGAREYASKEKTEESSMFPGAQPTQENLL